ncbi:hypothetical protein JVU11DRAFT_4615 [Chiua virens]|nr:hypothetical protein JVU11DRAFT_4615 [Chiua virens]
MSTIDVRGVLKRFDEANIDVFWLDIEYSGGHSTLCGTRRRSLTPVEMVVDVEGKQQKTQRQSLSSNPVSKASPTILTASGIGVLVNPKSGECELRGWPGYSSWIDFFKPNNWDLWIESSKTKSADGPGAWTQSSENAFHFGDQRSRDLDVKR